MRDFFKDLWDSKTIFIRFIKLCLMALAMVLTGLARVMTVERATLALVVAGILAGLAAFIPSGDKTPENVKQLANVLPDKMTPSTLNAAVSAAKDQANA